MDELPFPAISNLIHLTQVESCTTALDLCSPDGTIAASLGAVFNEVVYVRPQSLESSSDGADDTDYTILPLENVEHGSVDLAYLHDVLFVAQQTGRSPLNLIASAAQILKPGGALVAGVSNPLYYRTFTDLLFGKFLGVSSLSIRTRSVLGGYGFSDVAVWLCDESALVPRVMIPCTNRAVNAYVQHSACCSVLQRVACLIRVHWCLLPSKLIIAHAS